MDEKLKHLEMIEYIINKKSNNSAKLKEWTMGLVAAIGALAAVGTDRRVMVVSLVPIIGFWLLDTYYLRLERKYKILYTRVAADSKTDFNLNTNVITYSKEEQKRIDYIRCLFAPSVLVFYPPIALAVIILARLL